MCMEDVRIGRRSVSQIRTGVCPLAGGLFIPANDRRIGLVISGPVTNRFTLSTTQLPVLDAGINMYPGGFPLVLDLDYHGQLVTQGLYAVSAVADQTVGYAETIYPADDAPPVGG